MQMVEPALARGDWVVEAIEVTTSAKGTRLSRVALCRGRDHIVVPVVDLLDEDDDGMTPDYFLG
jgi:hypothetical protein